MVGVDPELNAQSQSLISRKQVELCLQKSDDEKPKVLVTAV